MQVSDSYDLHNRTWKCLVRSNLTCWATKFCRIAYSLLQKAAIPPFFLYCLPTTFVPVSARPISFSNTGTRSNLQSLLRELVPARCFSGFLLTAGDVPGRLHLLNRFPRTPCVALACCHVCCFYGHPKALLSVKTHCHSPLWL